MNKELYLDFMEKAVSAYSADRIAAYIADVRENMISEHGFCTQLLSFDENGMFRDPHEPVVYDMVARLQLATALYFGYDVHCRQELEEQLVKSADATLQMQSMTGEIPYGGRHVSVHIDILPAG